MKRSDRKNVRDLRSASNRSDNPPKGDPERLEAKRLLRTLGASPKRSLGQHFLVSSHILDRIVSIAGVSPDDRVLEIGPGLGFLTRRLLSAGAQIIALEKDDRFAAHLQSHYRSEPRLHVLHGDALSWPLDELALAEAQTRVIANLPYNIAVPIVFRLLEARPSFADLHLMVQKEVARRMTASPGTSAYGALSVGIQRHADVSGILEVPPRAFYPPPEVDSTVIRLVPHRRVTLSETESKAFRNVVRAAFGARRKTLNNALRASGYDRARIRWGLEHSHIDGNRRGETLSLMEFITLTRILEKGPGTLGHEMPSSSSENREK